MEKAVEQAVGRVIEAMRDNLGEPLTIDDMARTAMFSKFHFSRIFQRVTGVSPGRFLSAMRLHEAKRLLVSTSLSVTDISHRVGYNSVGTFSSRFRNSVGVPPSTYRQLGGFTHRGLADQRRRPPRQSSAVVSGRVDAAVADGHGLIFVGLFAEPVPQGQPVRSTVLHRPGEYTLEDVPPGTWYLLAHSLAANVEDAVRGAFDDTRTLCVGHMGPIQVRPDTATVTADLSLRPIEALDPSVVNALLGIQAVALTVGAA
ncbi:MAG TPA: AraC family transcriptional regulator [Pseudonocardiaceae bacterium]